jgi:hypothetical protein
VGFDLHVKRRACFVGNSGEFDHDKKEIGPLDKPLRGGCKIYL